MVVIPGQSESLGAVGKRIIHFDITETLLSVEVASPVRWAQCPTCSHSSSRRHGQYRRHLRAQPSKGRTVNLSVQVRRFKCTNMQCSRTTFVEQIEGLAKAQQRRTIGLSSAWCAMAQALGGSAAARLSAKLGMAVSRDTLLRELRRLGREVATAPPVVVGIDDWAITRGHRYGTIVVDLERRCPIEVLDGRESTGVAGWLQRHPSIQVVARDRAGAYSDAAQTMIPHPQQVADRWHLLGNLHETVERLLLRHNAKLREAAPLVAGITDVWNELRTQGFTGSRGTVRLAMAQAFAAASSSSDAAGRPGRRAATPSSQRVYGWLVGWDERGNKVPKRAEHRRFVEALCAIEPQIAEAISLTREFLGLIHRRDVDGVDRCLVRARESKAAEVRRFSVRLTADLSAVRAAFESSWSSGQVEGQINRLKFLKRQMFGRANLDLLRARVLHPN